MKKFSITYKIIALVLVLAFTFQSMESINSHAYKTGVYNIHNHFEMSCFSFLNNHNLIHMNFNCTY